ncbi:MAG: PilT/PilU family type 4a pilus ATPase [Phycisphaerae bacterium]|jgi:twitching motility protein PilT|nr:PilT/PilU family type 4a pilus ATPase [Phycisphaerae bacterium]
MGDSTPDAADVSDSTPSAPRLARYFEAMVKADASDLHLKPSLPPHLRIGGQIRSAQGKALSNEDILSMVDEMMTDKQRAIFAEMGSVDMAYELPGSDRFRINVFLQRGEVAAAVRRVTRSIPDFKSLHLPPIVEKIASERQGLVLLSGPTGGGKSTTLAAMLQHINQTRACHIVTLEDPIEYLYEGDKALVSQREIGIDTLDFQTALKYVFREDPDVVLIGELRDYDTFSAALQVAETGHLVLGTVHASRAPQTVGRLMDLFPPEARDRVRQLIGFNLRAVICQKLLPSISKDADMVPACEVMLMDHHIRKLVSEGRDADLEDAIRSHELEGMQTFAKSLCDLIDAGLIEPRVAYDAAPDLDELQMMLTGISASRAGLRG